MLSHDNKNCNKKGGYSNAFLQALYIFKNNHSLMVNPYSKNFSMLSQTLSETLIFNLSASGATSASNIKNTMLIIAQTNLIGSSMMSVIILINKITPHAMMNKTGFMMFCF